MKSEGTYRFMPWVHCAHHIFYFIFNNKITVFTSLLNSSLMLHPEQKRAFKLSKIFHFDISLK